MPVDAIHQNIHLPRGQRVYAIGDIHGRFDLLKTMHSIISEDLEMAPIANACVVYLGDYIDRGPASLDVIDCILNTTVPGTRSIFLMGNHEQMMLDFIDKADRRSGRAWFNNGAEATLISYGIVAPSDSDYSALAATLSKRLPDEHVSFLRSLRYRHQIGDVLFVHAGIDPDRPLDDQDDHDLIWIRDKFLNFDGDFGVLVVHGHTPGDTVEAKPNRINVDTRAFRSGVLSAAVLENKSLRFLST